MRCVAVLSLLVTAATALAAKPGLPLILEVTPSPQGSTLEPGVLRIRLTSVIDLPRVEVSATLNGGALPGGRMLWQGPLAADTTIELDRNDLPAGTDWMLRVQVEAETDNGRRLSLVREHQATGRRSAAGSSESGRTVVSEGRRLRVFDLQRAGEPR